MNGYIQSVCAGLALTLVTTAPLPATLVPSSGGVAQANPQRSAEDLREQGIVYHRKKMFKRALAVLDEAAATPEGARDFDVALYQAKSAYELLLLEHAFDTLARAEKLATTPAQRADASELRGQMSGLYGAVTFVTGEGETNQSGRIHFATETGIINKEKRERFEAIRERFRSTDVRLPRTVYLPYGDYTANNVPFTIVEGQPPSEVRIILQVQKEDEDGDNTAWWIVGGVGGAAVVATVVTLLLLPDDEASPVNYEILPELP